MADLGTATGDTVVKGGGLPARLAEDVGHLVTDKKLGQQIACVRHY
jgi:hypothetical protein